MIGKKRFSLKNYPLEDKIILVRVDYNVPLDKGKVTDNTKLKLSLPTIKLLLQKNCKIVLATHLGRPNGKFVPEFKTDILAKELRKLLPKVKIVKVNDCIGKDVKEEINAAKNKQIILLENLRFYNEEGENDFSFAHSLASLANVYVNDAFANSHRKHASMAAITKFLPSLEGLTLEKEIFYLNQAVKAKKPSVWILGGSKLDKVDLINQAFKRADKILIGGALAFSFLLAKGIKVGSSKSDIKSVKTAREILNKKIAKKIVLPVDFIVSEKFSARAKTKIVKYNEIKSNQIALDLGPETVKLFEKYLSDANTIVWNGPLGYFEWASFAKSTIAIGRFLGKLKAVKIVGGGETAEAINKFHLQHNFTHISSGGGAALTFLSGKKMPGIDVLQSNYKKLKKEVN